MSLSSRSGITASLIIMTAACMLFAVVFAGQAKAGTPLDNTYETDFENPPFTPGSPNGQDGWTNTNENFDHEIEDISGNTDAPDGFDDQTFRISNAVTSGSFGDQTFSAPVTEAGETDAENDGQSEGTRQTRFVSTFEFTSAAPGAEQEDLNMVVSPDRGDGARMSWVEFTDQDDGLRVRFADYQSGATDDQEGADLCDDAGCFVYTTLAEGLARDGVYTVEIVMDFVDGANNDVVRATVKNANGQAVGFHTGTSWEDYYRDREDNPTRTVDSLLFRTAGTAAPGTSGEGFFIDNLSIETSQTPGGDSCEIVGTAGDDTIEGFEDVAGFDENDTICGLGGDDTILGLGGSDTIIGNDGDDTVFGGAGADLIRGDDGDDILAGNETGDRIIGGSGNDRLIGNEGNDILQSGAGNDRLRGLDGNDRVQGQSGNDVVVGGDGNDRTFGQAGNDVLITRDGVRGNDLANGGGGNDRCAIDPRDRTISCER